MKIEYKNDRRFLISNNDRSLGVVYDLDKNEVYGPTNFQSILLRGYWEPYTGSQDLLDVIVKNHNIEW
jgi:hypothetical protein